MKQCLDALDSYSGFSRRSFESSLFSMFKGIESSTTSIDIGWSSLAIKTVSISGEDSYNSIAPSLLCVFG